MSLKADVGASDSNSYCTVEEANTFHASRLGSDTWDGASPADKEKALMSATWILDAFFSSTGDPRTQQQNPNLPKNAYFQWTGQAASETQALCWPRVGMVSRNGFPIASNVLPKELKNATAEFARQLLDGDRTLDNDVEAMGITSLRAGPVSLSFKDVIVKKTVPDAVVSLLVPSWCIKSMRTEVFKVIS